jgi:hypothetical protein
LSRNIPGRKKTFQLNTFNGGFCENTLLELMKKKRKKKID